MPRQDRHTQRPTKAARRREARFRARREPTSSTKTAQQHAVPPAFIGIDLTKRVATRVSFVDRFFKQDAASGNNLREQNGGTR
jgi:hypothetical protein